MSRQNSIHTLTITQQSTAPSHGKISAITCSEAMDVDQDGQRLGDPNETKDTMDTTIKVLHSDAPSTSAQQEPDFEAAVSATAEQPTVVLERPREGDGEVGEAQQSSTVMRKTPH